MHTNQNDFSSCTKCTCYKEKSFLEKKEGREKRLLGITFASLPPFLFSLSDDKLLKEVVLNGGPLSRLFSALHTRWSYPKKALEMNGLKDVPERGESC